MTGRRWLSVGLIAAGTAIAGSGSIGTAGAQVEVRATVVDYVRITGSAPDLEVDSNREVDVVVERDRVIVTTR